MADNTKIEWADATVNYVNGCSVVSPGCTNCYAMRLAGTRMKHHPSRAGLTQDSKAGPVWTGEVRAWEPALQQVLGWKRPRRIFWNAHGDLFHPNVPDAWIDRQFAVMALTPQHTHMVLTKRPERTRAYLADARKAERVADEAGRLMENGDAAWSQVWNAHWPLLNVWLGTSVEDQARADERIPHLLATPAAVRFLSCEPLLGPVDLRMIRLRQDGQRPTELSNRLGDYVQPLSGNFTDSPRIDWVIAGGESGPGSRPMHPDWVRSLRDQCAAAGVAFHFKQWGDWFPYGQIDAERRQNSVTRGEQPGLWHDWGTLPGFSVRLGKKAAGRVLDGRTHDDHPGLVVVGERGMQLKPLPPGSQIIPVSEVPY